MKILLIFLIAFSAHAKRLAPVKIDPLPVKKGTVHQVFKKSAHGHAVYLEKKDLSGQTLWKTKLFYRLYDKNLETDVQDIWLKKLTYNEDGIFAVDERGKTYQVDPSDGALMKPLKAHSY